jgi:membrane-associated phospholipid phosphatase
MRPIWRFVLTATLLIVLAHLLDGWAWAELGRTGVYDNDRGRLLRIIGYYPLWMVLGLAIWLETRNRRYGLLVALVPGVAGLVAEVLKILLRRERPGLHDGAYVFRAFSDQFWSTKQIGLPSSHALVAFAGAWSLVKLYPRARWVWVALAAGCALTRVQARAHFLSDVTVAAIAAWVVVEVVWRRMARPPASTTGTVAA